MVRLNYLVRDGVLVLRISEAKTRFYKRVGYLLKGSPNLKHFNKDKQKFCAYATESGYNNKALEDYKEIYWRLIQLYPEMSAKQVAGYYQSRTPEHNIPIKVTASEPSEYSEYIEKYLEMVILREKPKQGCNFEVYQKLLSRCRKDIPCFSQMTFSQVNFNFMVNIAHIFGKRRSYLAMAKSFRALLGKASRDNEVNFSIGQIGDFVFKDYDPDKNIVIQNIPEVLSQCQLKTFLNSNSLELTPKFKNRKAAELYHDFCVFMFHTFLSPCDIIKLRERDVTRKGTLILRRKKTHRQVEVPISPAAKEIIDKYSGKSKDGYVFPIMDDKENEASSTKDYLFKKFRQRLNIWLKQVGKVLQTDFDMHSYVFRHTAITVAINNGLPISYVANAAGTSIDMIQKHYYNGECERNRELLKRAFMSAGA